MATKAAAMRWFTANIGRQVNTMQVKPSGITWEPGPRTVSARGKTQFLLDGSTVSFNTPNDVVLDVTDSLVRLEWLDRDGVRIHVTTYTLID